MRSLRSRDKYAPLTSKFLQKFGENQRKPLALQFEYLIMASTEDLALSSLGRAVASGYEENGLQRTQSRHNHNPYEVPNEHVSTPRADGGKEAWLFLAGCFCIEALTWGECIS